MIRDSYRYVQTNILMDKFLKDTRNEYRVVGQREYKGKPEANLDPGTTFTLMIMHDDSEPIKDKKTGVQKDSNVFESFDATVPGCKYPAPYKKGDFVRLDGFMENASFYVDFNFILRFSKIEKIAPPSAKKEN